MERFKADAKKGISFTVSDLHSNMERFKGIEINPQLQYILKFTFQYGEI